MRNFSEQTEQLKQLEATFNEYFVNEPIETFNAVIKRIAEEYNLWIENLNREREPKGEKLQNQLENVKKLEAELEKIKEEINLLPQNSSTVEARNKLIEQYNSLANKHRELAAAYKKEVEAFNLTVEKSNQEAAERKSRGEEGRKSAKENLNKYERWLKRRGPEKFCHELNELYASLLQTRQRSSDDAEDLEPYLENARALRDKLGSNTKKEQEVFENGALIVPVAFSEGEKGFLAIETGSSVVSITPEMVKILDIEEDVGEEVELYLAGGVRIKAPQLLIPEIAFEGKTANYVKAVVLNHPIPGVDGGLGLSFLNRFNYKIERDHPSKLTLDSSKESSLKQDFDVFISHKSTDVKYAKQIYDFLSQSEYCPFLSAISIPKGRSTEFLDEIDAALATSKHLVVVGSSPQNMTAPWVKGEWRRFEMYKNSGKKKGNIIPIRCNGMTVDDLPDALKLYESLTMTARDWKTTLINYLPRHAE